MIVDKPGSHFIFVLPWDHLYRHYNYINFQGRELRNKEYLEYWGKWIILGSRSRMDELAAGLDPHVEERRVPAAKFDREPLAAFHLGECVMCVYCDFRQRGQVWAILQGLGVENRAWVFERETMERWLPGGHLLESWISSHNLGPLEAEQVRDEARRKFAAMFANDNAIFRGVYQ